MVVPYVGTWIEMPMATLIPVRRTGRSLRGNVDRNLVRSIELLIRYLVVPYVGTWIEIRDRVPRWYAYLGRSLRGNVDRNIDLLKNHYSGCGSFPTWERG